MLRKLVFPLVLILAACGGAADVADDASAEAEADDAELTSSATLTFKTDGTVSQTGDLVVGGTVKFAYSADRLPGCRGDMYGHPAWSITGYAKQAGGDAKTFEAGGYSPSGGSQQPVLNLTAAGELQVWFQVTNMWGCQAWDSDYGRNYRFTVQAKPSTTTVPTIAFKRDYTQAVTGTLKAGKAVNVTYDLARLPKCRQTYNGLGTWDIVMSYRYDGGSVKTATVTSPNGVDRVAKTVKVIPPAGTKTVEVWFKNTDRTGCTDWDSNYGGNYKFKLN